jgi:isopenicillin-N N-acyltransferase-like protein
MLRRVLFLVALTACAACVPPPRRRTARIPEPRSDGSFLRRREGIWEGRFAGDPYTRGWARGRLAYDQIASGERDLDALMRRMVPSGTRRMWLRALLSVALRRSQRFISADHTSEIAGIADAETPDPLPGGWTPYARQLSLHALHDFSQRFIDVAPLSGACTGFAARGPATADGDVYLARNFDFEAGDRFDREKIVAAIVPEKGFSYLSVTFGGLTGVVSGMNDRGLALSQQALAGGPTASRGEPSSLLAADVLQFDSTVEEAAARIRGTPVLVSDLYLLADRSGTLAVVEKTPAQTAVRYGSPTIAVANSSEIPEISTRVGPAPPGGTSAYRQRRIGEILVAEATPIDARRCVRILRDRRGLAQAPLGPGNRNAIDAWIACHSVVFDVTRGRAWVSAGPHTLGPYVAFDLKLLATAAPEDPRFAALSSESIEADPALSSGEYARYRQARRENLRARQLLAAGRAAQAREYAARAVALAPGFVEALACRGQCAARLSRFTEAVADFDAALALSPGPPDFRAEIQRARADAAARRAGQPIRFPRNLEDEAGQAA